MLEKNITDLVNYVVGHPGANVASIADHFLAGNIEGSTTRDIVIPDLVKLAPSKRALVVNIVRNKTNCNLYSDNDYQHNYVKIKEVGEVMREVPKFAKKVRWLFQ